MALLQSCGAGGQVERAPVRSRRLTGAEGSMSRRSCRSARAASYIAASCSSAPSGNSPRYALNQLATSDRHRGLHGIALPPEHDALGRVEAEALQPVSARADRPRAADDDCQAGREHQGICRASATCAGAGGREEITPTSGSATWSRRHVAGSGRRRQRGKLVRFRAAEDDPDHARIVLQRLQRLARAGGAKRLGARPWPPRPAVRTLPAPPG